MPGKTFMARSFVAATEHPLASLAAFRAIEKGGNVFDAAAAASFSLTVLHPHLSSLGGDFFALFYRAEEDRIYCLNSSGWSPSSATVDEMKRNGLASVPRYGPWSVVIPGYVKGVHEMQTRFGALEFSKTLGEAIELAETGFPIGEGLVGSLRSSGDQLSAAARETFMPGGRVPRVGSRLVQKSLAATLRRIARDGPQSFYGGAPGEAIMDELGKGGVHVSEEDLTDFSPEWCEPLRIEYRGTDVYEVPPNSMGATTLLILKLLERAPPDEFRVNSVERVKATVDAATAAYAARDEMLGDPRFTGFDLEEFLSRGEGYVRQQRIDKADTTYFAIADARGNVLSCIQSVFHAFGSRVYVDDGGFFLNNRASSFRTDGPNGLEPRKRPLHTLSALLLSRGGRPYAAMGCSGGEFRPQQHALFVGNMLDYSMDLEGSLTYPRFLWEGEDSVRVEAGFTGLDRLRMSKRLLAYPGATGVAQGVEVREDAVVGVCDVRGEGLPMGS